MDALNIVMYLLHMLGLFGLLAAAVLAMADRAGAKAAAFHSSLLQLVTGLVLVGLMYADGEEPNNTKIGVKFLILLVITGLAVVYKRKTDLVKPVYVLIGVLALANTVIAYAW